MPHIPTPSLPGPLHNPPDVSSTRATLVPSGVPSPRGTPEDTALRILAGASALTVPALREAVDGLAPDVRHAVGVHFGWWDLTGGPLRASQGKMVRPALVLACCRAVGGDKMQGLPAAVAVELIHNASLLHDDIIDHDATRRGRPTLWAQLGLPAAILAGDALFFLAIDVLTDAGGPLAVGGINSLTAATQKLIGGEYTDVLLEEQTSAPLSVVEAMAQAKTGELIAEACALGALAGGASPATISLLKRFGVHLGAAFQLVDDILGIWGDPLQTGKPGYSDLRARKKSLPVAAALNAGGPAAARLGELYARAEPFSEEELTLVAGLVDQANGRAWAEKTAASHIRAARRHLVAACPSPGAAEDLNVLARMITHRDR